MTMEEWTRQRDARCTGRTRGEVLLVPCPDGCGDLYPVWWRDEHGRRHSWRDLAAICRGPLRTMMEARRG